MSFCNNSVLKDGGAIYQTHSVLFFTENAVVKFAGNYAQLYGGAIYQTCSSKIFFRKNAVVDFTGNGVGVARFWDFVVLYILQDIHLFHLKINQ